LEKPVVIADVNSTIPADSTRIFSLLLCYTSTVKLLSTVENSCACWFVTRKEKQALKKYKLAAALQRTFDKIQKHGISSVPLFR